MTLAPRSCPSSPGLAMTTLIRLPSSASALRATADSICAPRLQIPRFHRLDYRLFLIFAPHISQRVAHFARSSHTRGRHPAAPASCSQCRTRPCAACRARASRRLCCACGAADRPWRAAARPRVSSICRIGTACVILRRELVDADDDLPLPFDVLLKADTRSPRSRAADIRARSPRSCRPCRRSC